MVTTQANFVILFNARQKGYETRNIPHVSLNWEFRKINSNGIYDFDYVSKTNYHVQHLKSLPKSGFGFTGSQY